MMTIYFQNARGGRTPLASNENINVLRKAMWNFCAERGYKIYYTRSWINDANELQYDVGSHSEFFIVTGPKADLEKAVTM